MTMEEQLQALLDKQAITELLQRYARTLDWIDDEGQASCYWPDAEIDYGFFKGKAEDFLPVVMQIERGSDRRWHMLSPPAIALHSATSASAECYGLFAGSKRQEDGTLAGNAYGGRYLDEFEKRATDSGDEWRISKRTYILDWSQALVGQPEFEPSGDLALPTLRISESGHPDYRAM